MKPCSTQGCTRPAITHGLCGADYKRLRKNGDLAIRFYQNSPGWKCTRCGGPFSWKNLKDPCQPCFERLDNKIKELQKKPLEKYKDGDMGFMVWFTNLPLR